MTASKRVLVKVDRDHNPDPTIMYHHWVFAGTGPRDALGRRNARLNRFSTHWLIFQCNNGACIGQCAVHPDAVAHLLPIHPANRPKAKP